jgi:hypothetical protein
MLVFLPKAKDERRICSSRSNSDGDLRKAFVTGCQAATVWSFRHQAGRTADGVSKLRRHFSCLRMVRCSGDGGGACCYISLTAAAAKELGHKMEHRWIWE